MKITYTFTAPDGFGDTATYALAVSKLMHIMSGALALETRGGPVVSKVDYGVHNENGTSFVCTAVEP